jgi:hypothetical protein
VAATAAATGQRDAVLRRLRRDQRGDGGVVNVEVAEHVETADAE